MENRKTVQFFSWFMSRQLHQRRQSAPSLHAQSLQSSCRYPTTLCPKSHAQQKRARSKISSLESQTWCSESYRCHGSPYRPSSLSDVALRTELRRKRYPGFMNKSSGFSASNGSKKKPRHSISNSLPLSRFHHQFLESSARINRVTG
jgi:hypothetical protein